MRSLSGGGEVTCTRLCIKSLKVAMATQRIKPSHRQPSVFHCPFFLKNGNFQKLFLFPLLKKEWHTHGCASSVLLTPAYSLNKPSSTRKWNISFKTNILTKSPYLGLVDIHVWEYQSSGIQPKQSKKGIVTSPPKRKMNWLTQTERWTIMFNDSLSIVS